MRNFDSLADIGKHRRMLADDVTGAYGGKTDSARHAFVAECPKTLVVTRM